MIELSNDEILSQHEKYMKAYLSSSGTSFLEDTYIKKIFPRLYKERNLVYPYDVRIAPSITEMLQGNFEPSRIIHIEKPFIGPYGVPIWFGDAAKGATMLCGYVNGDSRYPCEVAFDDKTAHGLIGGATGQGKSVLMNSIIWGMCLCYPPWALDLTLSDAKIVEFKSIAVSSPLPNISAIAATGDADYLISILEDKFEEMSKLNKVFTEASKTFKQSIKNLNDFIQITGLMYPRHVMLFDEGQAMFDNAGKKLSRLVWLIDQFARLGRNTCFNICISSQELSSEIPQKTLGNIAIRGALGCFAKTSEMLIGNDEAALNYGIKGRLIFNTNVTGKDDNRKHNILIRVPYMTPTQTVEIAKKCMDVAKENNVVRHLAFYDEEDCIRESRFKKEIAKYKTNENILFLGEPSFVYHDPCPFIKLEMGTSHVSDSELKQASDIENICIISPNVENQIRHFKMLKFSAELHDDYTNFVICANQAFFKADAKEFSPKFFSGDKNFSTNLSLASAKGTIRKRKLCLEVDKRVFEQSLKPNEDSDANFYQVFEKDSKYDTEINRARCYAAIGILKTDMAMQKLFEMDRLSKNDFLAKAMDIVKNTIPLFHLYHSSSTRLVVNKIPPTYIWILGLDRMMGLGRDCVTKNVTLLKQYMQDAVEVNTRYVLVTSTLGDCNDLHSAIRWYILDGIASAEINKIKAGDYYPNQILPGLAVMIDMMKSQESRCFKFKKMLGDNELNL